MLTLVLLALVSGCTTVRETQPSRTATEQLLISGAADRVSGRLELELPAGSKVAIDAAGFDQDSDHRYALGVIKEALLKQDYRLVNDKSNADVVVEIYSGALSIDKHENLVGIPSFPIPLPFTSGAKFPEIALYKSEQQRGIAKVVATAYDADDGLYIDSTSPIFGFSHQTRRTLLLFFNWTTSDLIPRGKRDDKDGKSLPDG